MEDSIKPISVYTTKSNVRDRTRASWEKDIVTNIQQQNAMSVSDLIYHGEATISYQLIMIIMLWFILAPTFIYSVSSMPGFFLEAWGMMPQTVISWVHLQSWEWVKMRCLSTMNFLVVCGLEQSLDWSLENIELAVFKWFWNVKVIDKLYSTRIFFILTSLLALEVITLIFI